MDISSAPSSEGGRVTTKLLFNITFFYKGCKFFRFICCGKTQVFLLLTKVLLVNSSKMIYNKINIYLKE